MTKLNSRQDLTDCIKVSSYGRSNYRPAELTDKTVYEMAQHYYTVEQIAEHFSVSAETVLKHHGDAFRAGKANAHMLPRFVMRRYFEELNQKESLLECEIIPLGDGKFKVITPDIAGMKGMIELHARMYEGLGAKTEVHHTGVSGYDAVESAPQIIERQDDSTA